MRLLKLDHHGEISLQSYSDADEIPPYAILSHTWGSDCDEISFSDVQNGLYKTKVAYEKVLFCGEQGKKDKLHHFWVDTCCIDKSNSTELTENIVSMFRYYHNAVKCYVYLSDVSSLKRTVAHDDGQSTEPAWRAAFQTSRWFTRGWTLQELLAPQVVEFFSRESRFLGSKVTLGQLISEITRIPINALHGAHLSEFSIGERMRWADQRFTSRIEDKAYCLLGIFDVYMVPIYGERENAFTRLEKEIASKVSDANLSVTATELLTSTFRFRSIDDRQDLIKDAHQDTFRWMIHGLTTQEYHSTGLFRRKPGLNVNDPIGLRAWLRSGVGVFRIVGKIGCGKSTFMKLITTDLQCRHELRAWAGSLEILTIKYFAWSSGDPLQKSIYGFQMSALCQAFGQSPSLLQEILTLQDRNHGERFARSSVPWGTDCWTKIEIERFWNRFICQKDIKLCVFLDGLDELDENKLAVAQFVNDLVHCKNGRIKVIVAGRDEPRFDQSLHKNIGHVRILMHEWTNADIQRLVRDSLNQHPLVHRRPLRGPGDQEMLISSVVRKAEGVFIWATTAIQILLEGEMDGIDIQELYLRLQSLSPDLHNLYMAILVNMGKEDLIEAATYFSLLRANHRIYAKCSNLQDKFRLHDYLEQLDLFHFHVFLECKLDENGWILRKFRDWIMLSTYQNPIPPCTPWRKNERFWIELAPKLEKILRRVQRCCTHFCAYTDRGHNQKYIQFSHRSAIDFLSSPKATAMLAEFSPSPQDVECRLWIAKFATVYLGNIPRHSGECLKISAALLYTLSLAWRYLPDHGAIYDQLATLVYGILDQDSTGVVSQSATFLHDLSRWRVRALKAYACIDEKSDESRALLGAFSLSCIDALSEISLRPNLHKRLCELSEEAWLDLLTLLIIDQYLMSWNGGLDQSREAKLQSVPRLVSRCFTTKDNAIIPSLWHRVLCALHYLDDLFRYAPINHVPNGDAVCGCGLLTWLYVLFESFPIKHSTRRNASETGGSKQVISPLEIVTQFRTTLSRVDADMDDGKPPHDHCIDRSDKLVQRLQRSLDETAVHVIDSQELEAMLRLWDKIVPTADQYHVLMQKTWKILSFNAFTKSS